MFYLLPAAGTSETLTGTGKNRLPEDSTHWPVSGSREPVPVTGTWNWLVCPRLEVLAARSTPLPDENQLKK